MPFKLQRHPARHFTTTAKHGHIFAYQKNQLRGRLTGQQSSQARPQRYKISKPGDGHRLLWLWLRKILLLAAASGCLVGLVWLLATTKFFNVKNITATPSQFVDTYALENEAWQMAAQRRFYLLPQTLWPLFDSNTLRRQLLSEYNFSSLTIQKQWNGTIVIKAEAQTPVLIWQEGESGALVAKTGDIVALATAGENDLPVVINQGAPLIQVSHVNEDSQTLNSLLELSQVWSTRQSNLPIKNLLLDGTLKTIKLQIVSGPVLYFSTDTPIATQMDKLDAWLKSVGQDNFYKNFYIDLRFGDKIFQR